MPKWGKKVEVLVWVMTCGVIVGEGGDQLLRWGGGVKGGEGIIQRGGGGKKRKEGEDYRKERRSGRI